MDAKLSIALFVLAFYLGGCTTVGNYQAECEQKNSLFPDVVQCLKTSLASDSRMARNSRVKLYTLKADQLSQMVQKKEITEIDARVALQELYVRLKRDEDVEVDGILANMPKNTTTRTNCYSIGNNINCTTR